ncbi:unnamed protein product [Prunus armeniaca]|uniref:Uncharacterized protein n=1 Tax=Prunus armeniaca TaxID=36596 RepID=A0A6J5XVE0_PRUAR|nr:unnamed protein product [Prunus armeniaca]
MAIPHSLKLIRLLRKAWSTLKQSNARRDKNQKKRAKASLPSVLSQIHELDTIYVETASDMKVVQTLINAKQPWKGTHIVVKTKQDATTATIKQKAVELKLQVIESDDWEAGKSTESSLESGGGDTSGENSDSNNDNAGTSNCD